MAKNRNWLKRTGWAVVILFILANLIAVFHAYKFTHFVGIGRVKTKDPKGLSATEKLRTLIFGVNNPRPENDSIPSVPYETLRLKSNSEIECWYIRAEQPKGTMILCHGFAGSKSTMLDKAEVFREMGYSVLLVDFMGSGGSEGNQTTIGYYEAEQVRTCFDYLSKNGERNIYLFGTSMGAVAIMKAIADYRINPAGIIIECPFGTMYQTVCARFRTMHVPTFPMAGLLVFWGGVENGFWAFGHNPERYAKEIHCPTLLLYGAKDDKVSRQEIDAIYSKLSGPKKLSIYPEAGHENYLVKYKREWSGDVMAFINAR